MIFLNIKITKFKTKNLMKKSKNLVLDKNVYLSLKKVLDIFSAFVALILISPIFLPVIILIKFSSMGPIFFLHKRIRKKEKTFYCIKFRTMHPEANDILKNILSRDEEIRREYQETQKIKNDPRITNIGKFLRKTSLDEIPQLINVIRGEMSIVGPRPIIEEEKIRYGDTISNVFSVNPGITGLWQVSGRNNLTYKKRVELDNLYVNNVNFFMDLRIMIRTIGVILFPGDRGAY